MKTIQRNYSEEKGDFRKLSDFFINQSAYLREYSTWSLPRFIDWKYGLYKSRTAVAGFWEKNARLWFDGFDKLAGFVIAEEGGKDFIIITAPGYRLLFTELLDWVMGNWLDRPDGFCIELTEKQHYEIEILKRLNFQKVLTYFLQEFDLTKELPQRHPLAGGFSIIDMVVNPEYKAQRIMRANAFESITQLTETELAYQLEFYNHSHYAPTYEPYTDLCIKAQDGRHVAGCEALIDPWNCIAEIERVCTHSDFRRRGFARIIIRECLERLKKTGFLKAYISGYSTEANTLYDSLGASLKSNRYVYKQLKSTTTTRDGGS